jgi:nicotinamidase-related amidase
MKKALLVIDVQEIYTNPELGLYCADADRTLAQINRLIADFQAKNELVIYIKHSHKADRSDLGRMFDFAGPTDIADFIEQTPDVNFSTGLTMTDHPVIVHKNRYSSFHNTNLSEILQKNAIEQVVICGFMTNFCCESAARDAHDLDYFVDFIIDATGTPGVEGFNQDATRHAVSQMLSAGFAVVKTVDEYLA